MDLSNAHELYIPEGEVTEIHSIDGVIWRKRTYFSAIIASNRITPTTSNKEYGISITYKGKGKIYLDGNLISEVDTTDSDNKSSISVVSGETVSTEHTILMEGVFSLINIAQTSGTDSSVAWVGKWINILSWDSNINHTYKDMFAANQGSSLIELKLPSWITTLANGTFNATGLTEVRIPKQISNIESNAIGDSYIYNRGTLKTIYFEHPAVREITLPTPGTSGMAYSKNARELIVYTDNEYIKNYDWVTDNVTPIFYHLNGQPWEEPPINDDSQYAQYMDFIATGPFIVYTFENQPIKIVSLDESGNEVDPIHIDPDADITLEIIPTTDVVNGDTPNMRVYTVENGTFAVLVDSVVDNDGRLEEKLSEYSWSQGETSYLPTVIVPYLGYVGANPRGPDIENPDPYNRIVCWDNITDSDDQVEESEYWVQI